MEGFLNFAHHPEETPLQVKDNAYKHKEKTAKSETEDDDANNDYIHCCAPPLVLVCFPNYYVVAHLRLDYTYYANQNSILHKRLTRGLLTGSENGNDEPAVIPYAPLDYGFCGNEVAMAKV